MFYTKIISLIFFPLRKNFDPFINNNRTRISYQLRLYTNS